MGESQIEREKSREASVGRRCGSRPRPVTARRGGLERCVRARPGPAGCGPCRWPCVGLAYVAHADGRRARGDAGVCGHIYLYILKTCVALFS